MGTVVLLMFIRRNGERETVTPNGLSALVGAEADLGLFEESLGFARVGHQRSSDQLGHSFGSSMVAN